MERKSASTLRMCIVHSTHEVKFRDFSFGVSIRKKCSAQQKRNQLWLTIHKIHKWRTNRFLYSLLQSITKSLKKRNSYTSIQRHDTETHSWVHSPTRLLFTFPLFWRTTSMPSRLLFHWNTWTATVFLLTTVENLPPLFLSVDAFCRTLLIWSWPFCRTVMNGKRSLESAASWGVRTRRQERKCECNNCLHVTHTQWWPGQLNGRQSEAVILVKRYGTRSLLGRVPQSPIRSIPD